MSDQAARLPAPIAEERFGGSPALKVLAVGSMLLAAVIGATVAVNPLAGAIGGGAIALAMTFMLAGHRLAMLFLAAVACLLVLYAFLGRGVAHLGAPPIYIGEIGLVLAIPAILVSLRRVRLGPVELLIVLFMFWGVIRTIPYLSVYGIDALRDGVLWGYGLFALGIAWTVRTQHIRFLVRAYRRLVPLLLFWTPVAAVAALVFRDSIPAAPGSEVPLLYFKPGDYGVHLAGIAAFVLVGLYDAVTPSGAIRQALLWAGWLLGAAIAGAISRGGLLAVSMVVTAALFVRSSSRWLTFIIVALVVVCLAIIANPTVGVPGRSRDVSVQQLAANVLSVFVDTDEAGLAGTKNWRLEWWDEITRYTIFGPYMLEGKGFGVNLADDDGFQVLSDGSLRSPHSSHFEILARGGVVGLTLWVLIQLSVAWVLLRTAWRSRAAGHGIWVAIAGWLFVYWAAALVNSSFDVYLQGPQGGIWFWTVVGLAIAVSRLWSESLDVADIAETEVARGPDSTAQRTPGTLAASSTASRSASGR